MSRTLIRQVQFVPLAALLAIIATGILMPNHSSLSQHMSELGILDHPAARVLHIGAMVSGASVSLFGLGLMMHGSRRFMFTSTAAIIYGIAHFSAGIFDTGSPLHGLYGLTMFYVLVPALFAAELPGRLRSHFIIRASAAAAVLSLGYMWFLYSGLEPHSIRGATQRLGALLIFSWYPLAGYWLLRPEATASGGADSGIAPALG